MACPFFLPSERAENVALPHPARLPLGAAWRGTCGTPGGEFVQLGEVQFESCNLGYALSCPHLPKERAGDAVRFCVMRRSPERVLIQFVIESRHLPVAHGALEYDRISKRWTSRHINPAVQRQAECFLQAQLEREGSELSFD